MTPRVTVLMSVWNGAAHLRAAIESVLSQTFRDFEFLIFDDASTDATGEILAQLQDERMRVVRNETNAGLTVSLNRGLQLARGALIARHDADDLSHSRRLELQVAHLDANPAVAAVGSQALLVDAHGAALGNKDFPLTHDSICWMHLFDNALAHSAVTFRKASVQALGGYDERFTASQDYDLWSRLSAAHELANLRERLVTLRVLESSITRTHKRPELIRQIQAQHFTRIFPGREATPAQLDLLAQFRSRVEPSALPQFQKMTGEWLRAYAAAHPQASRSSDFRRTLALQAERIGYNLLATDRAAGSRELLRAIRLWPPRLLHLPWFRIAALAVFGDSARAMYEKLFRKSGGSAAA